MFPTKLYFKQNRFRGSFSILSSLVIMVFHFYSCKLCIWTLKLLNQQMFNEPFKGLYFRELIRILKLNLFNFISKIVWFYGGNKFVIYNHCLHDEEKWYSEAKAMTIGWCKHLKITFFDHMIYLTYMWRIPLHNFFL